MFNFLKRLDYFIKQLENSFCVSVLRDINVHDAISTEKNSENTEKPRVSSSHFSG